MKFKLKEETLYLTINIIDRYLSTKNIHRSKLQLLGITSMLIASKYEEIYAPEIRDFVYIADHTYTKEEILEQEIEILTVLKFDVLTVSSLTFLERFHQVSNEFGLKVFHLALFILEFSLFELKIIYSNNNSKLAASCLYLARKILKYENAWSPALLKYSQYTEQELKVVAKDICAVLELIPKITLKACVNKFKHVNYSEVANLQIFKFK